MPGADNVRELQHRSRWIYALLLAGTLVWCSGIVAAPLMEDGPWNSVSSFLYTFFHPICNQLDSHSLHIAGHKMAVCARCTSIYFAFLLGLLAYPMVRSISARSGAGRGWVALAVAPMLIDVALSVLRIHTSTAFTRVLTGGFFGLIAVFVVVPTVVDGLLELMTRSRVQPSPTIKKD